MTYHDRTIGDLHKLADAGIGGTTTERIALIALVDNQGLPTMSELGRMVPLSRAATTTLVDRLEHDGLVQRTALSGDRRVSRVSLTISGYDKVAFALGEGFSS